MVNNMESVLFDFHSHILPKMDDGSTDFRASLEMLRALSKQGVTDVFCTPHFLPMHESTADFICRRKNSYEALRAYIKSLGEQNLPNIKLGAEIRVTRNISEADLGGLEYEGISALLLELPRETLSRQIVKQICNLCVTKRYIPIIAHLDRYKWFKPKDIHILSDIPDVVFQFNTDALSHFFTKRAILKLARDGHYILFGSDCHNTTDRAANFNLLTGEGGRSVLSAKERSLLLKVHKETQLFVFCGREQKNSGLFF